MKKNTTVFNILCSDNVRREDYLENPILITYAENPRSAGKRFSLGIDNSEVSRHLMNRTPILWTGVRLMVDKPSGDRSHDPTIVESSKLSGPDSHAN